MYRHAFTGAIALLVLAITGAVHPSQGFAQTNTRLTPPPRELLLQLQRGIESVKEDKYSDAIRQLGSVLAPPEDSEPEFKQDYFTKGESDSLQSLRAQAEYWIGKLPADGQRLYELRFGAEARALLEKASKEFDMLALADCTRRYFHTTAGHDATLLLGQLHLDEGRPAAAAFCFRRLAESPRAADYEPQASLLLAASWLYAGSEENARRILVDLKKRRPDLQIQAGGEQIRVFQNEQEALPWLQRVLASRGVGRNKYVEEWLTARGNAERNAQVAATPPVTNKSWRLPVANFPIDEDIVNDHLRDRQSNGQTLVPSLQAVATGDQVVMRTTRRVFGVDFATGKRIWEWPWDDEPDVDAENRSKIPNNGAKSNWAHDLSQRLWSDLPFGQLSSDGRSVFAISNLGVVPQSPNQIVFAVRNQTPTSNQLAALSLDRQGALQWIIGGDNGADEPQLAGAYFMAPPLPADGVLYTIAEVRDEVRLLALDPQTGMLQWQQQLAHVEGLGVTMNPLRQLAGAAPSLSSGVLVCPTTAGVVVAIDTSSRSLLWAYEYKTKLRPGYKQPFVSSSSNQSVDPEWHENAPVIQAGSVLIAPPDAGWLYALDLLTGLPLWDPIKRDDQQFIGCVLSDRIVLVGNDKITARRLSDSEVIWETKLPSAPSGRGVNTGAVFLVPTASSELLTIDLNSGDIVAQSKTEYVLGNLVSYRDHIISHGANFLTSFHQVEHLREVTQALLAKNPQDVKGLRYKIMLHLQDEQYREALEASLTAQRLYPNNAPIRTLLTRSVLRAFDRDFANTHQLAADLGGFMQNQPQYGEYLRRLSNGYGELGDHRRAFEALLAFASQADVERSAHEEMVLNGGATLASNDRWIRQQAADLFALAAEAGDQALLNQLRQQIQATGQAKLDSGDWTGLSRFLDQFSDYPDESKFQLAYARHLYEKGEYLATQIMLSRLPTDMDRPAQGAARALLAQTLLRAKAFEQAAVLFHELNDQYNDIVVWNDLTGAELFDTVSPSANIRVSAATHSWPYGEVDVESATDNSPSNNYPIVPFNSRQGVFGTKVAPYVRYMTSGLTITNESGRLVTRASLQRSGQTVFVRSSSQPTLIRAHSLGHLMIVSKGDEVLAIDGMGSVADPRRNVLWRVSTVVGQPGQRRTVSAKSAFHPWSSKEVRIVGPVINGNLVGVVGAVNAHGVCFTRGDNVVSVDPISGREQWVHHNVGAGCDLFGDEEYLFVVRDREDEALVLRTIDGSAVGQKKVPKLTNRWATFGRNILAWENLELTENEPPRRTAWIYDAWTDEQLWRASYTRDARGVVFDDDKVAIFEPADGILQVISLRDGRQILTQQLPHASRSIDHLVVRSVGDRLLVMLNEVPRSGRSSAQPPVSTNAIANGKLYCLDGEGQLVWPFPVVLDRYYFVEEQPSHSPVIVFHRMGQVNLRSAKRYYSVLAIDLRNGRALVDEHITSAGQRPMFCTVDADQNRVTLRFTNQRRVLTFSDNPRPPEPPVLTGESAPFVDPLTQAAATPTQSLDPSKLFAPQKR